MANNNAPFGFIPVGKVGQNGDNQGLSSWYIADNASTSIFQGDLVKLGSGYIAQGTASDPALGVFWGAFISKDPSTGKPKFTNFYTQTNVATGQTIEAFVYDDPYERFLVQAGSTGSIAQANVGSNYDVVVGTGNTINGQSAMVVDLETSGASSSLLVKFFGFSKEIGNDPTSANAKLVVQINEHQLKQPTIGV